MNGDRHGPANPNAGRKSSVSSIPGFPTPSIPLSDAPLPGPLPHPPRDLLSFPEPQHLKPPEMSRTMYYARLNQSSPAWLELDAPELPHRPHSDEPRPTHSKNEHSTSSSPSPGKLQVGASSRPRPVSSPPMTPSTSKNSSSTEKVGNGSVQCSARTRKGERCKRTVKNKLPLNVLDPDASVMLFCPWHRQEVSEKSEFLSSKTSKYLKFSGKPL